MELKLFQKIIFALSLFASSLTMAAVQQHTFSISGDNGESGTGSFTYDDAINPNGGPLMGPIAPGQVMSVSITVSGGNVVGGSTSFTDADCIDSYLSDTPDFLNAINFTCLSQSHALDPLGPLTARLFVNDVPSSLLSFTPGATAPVGTTPGATAPVGTTAIPTMSAYGLVLTMLGLLLVASRRVRASVNRR